MLRILCAKIFLFAILIFTGQYTMAAGDPSKILVIVNKEPITEHDVQQRIKLITFTGGGNQKLADSQKAEIILSIVQEKLQIQAAKRKKINVNEKDVDAALTDMAKENNMNLDQLVKLLSTNGISKETLASRIRAQLYWVKYIRQQYAPVVHVSDSEAETALVKMEAGKGEKQYLLSQITLQVTDQSQDGRVKADALKLAQELQKGAKFASLAQQLSKDNTAPQGGDMGWTTPSALETPVSEKLSSLTIGQISDPIKVKGGYKIIQLRDIRHAGTVNPDDLEVSFVQAVFPIKPSSTPEEANEIIPKVEEAMKASGCKAFVNCAKKGDATTQTIESAHLAQMPDQFKSMIKATPIGKCAQPVMTPDGLAVVMVCGKKEPKPVIQTKDDVMGSIEQEKYGKRAALELQRLTASAYYEFKDPGIKSLLKM